MTCEIIYKNAVFDRKYFHCITMQRFRHSLIKDRRSLIMFQRALHYRCGKGSWIANRAKVFALRIQPFAFICKGFYCSQMQRLLLHYNPSGSCIIMQRLSLFNNAKVIPLITSFAVGFDNDRRALIHRDGRSFIIASLLFIQLRKNTIV